MTFHSLSSSRLVRNTILGLLLAAWSTIAAVETASADSVVPNAIRICPDRVRGDGEFSGNGPEVWVQVNGVYPASDGSGLDANIYIKLKELKPDWTTAEYNRRTRIWTDPYGRRISVGGDNRTSSIHFWFPQDVHQSRKMPPVEGAVNGPVSMFEVMGDTKGHDVGIGCVGSWVIIYFNAIPVNF